MLNLSPADWIAILGVYITILGSVWTLGQYINGRFTKIFDKIDSVKDQILMKLEYHERHDDKRFSEIREDIWETRLRIAGTKFTRNAKKNAEEEAT